MKCQRTIFYNTWISFIVSSFLIFGILTLLKRKWVLVYSAQLLVSWPNKKLLWRLLHWYQNRTSRKRKWKERHFWMVRWSHIWDTTASSLTEIWSKNWVVLQPKNSYWINTQIEHVGCVSETSRQVDFENVSDFQNWLRFDGDIFD